MLARSCCLLGFLLVTCAASAQVPFPLEWEQVGSTPIDSEVAYALDHDGALLYAGYGLPDDYGFDINGVWRLPPPLDSTSAWEQVAPPPRASLRWVRPLAGDTLIVEEFTGYYRSTDRGQTWTLQGEDEGHSQHVLVVPPGVPYAGRIVVATSYRMASFSDDRGGSWQAAVEPGPPAQDATAERIAVVTAGPHAGRLVAAGSYGLTYSDDGGATWTPTADEYAHFQQTSNCIATLRGQASGGGDRLVAVVNDIRIPTDSVYVTTSDDGGDTWQRGKASSPARSGRAWRRWTSAAAGPWW